MLKRLLELRGNPEAIAISKRAITKQSEYEKKIDRAIFGENKYNKAIPTKESKLKKSLKSSEKKNVLNTRTDAFEEDGNFKVSTDIKVRKELTKKEKNAVKKSIDSALDNEFKGSGLNEQFDIYNDDFCKDIWGRKPDDDDYYGKKIKEK